LSFGAAVQMVPSMGWDMLVTMVSTLETVVVPKAV
jgi:hypothetical protein